MSKWAKLRTTLFLIFTGILVAGLLSYSLWGESIPLAEMQTLSQTSLSAPIIFIILYTLLSLIIPTTPLMALAGVLFGFAYGLIYSVVAGLISAIFIFTASRRLGGEFVENFLEKNALAKFHKYYDKIEHHGLLSVIILRMTPIMPFNILCLIMGVMRISFLNYTLGTLLGLLPSNALTVYFGTLVLTDAFRQFSFYLSIILFIVIMLWFVFRNNE